jgi:hypothetical protein
VRLAADPFDDDANSDVCASGAFGIDEPISFGTRSSLSTGKSQMDLYR